MFNKAYTITISVGRILIIPCMISAKSFVIFHTENIFRCRYKNIFI